MSLELLELELENINAAQKFLDCYIEKCQGVSISQQFYNICYYVNYPKGSIPRVSNKTNQLFENGVNILRLMIIQHTLVLASFNIFLELP
jgi:hypothetical protein